MKLYLMFYDVFKVYLLKQTKQYSPNKVETNGTSEVWASLRFQSLSTLSLSPFHIPHFSSLALLLVSSDSSVFPHLPDLLCPCMFVPTSFLPGTLACFLSQNWQIHLIDPSRSSWSVIFFGPPFLAPQMKSVIVKNILV